MTDPPVIRPGEVAGWPKLVLRYPTDPDRIADLLPPGLTAIGDPVVQIGIYCVPVHGEPEHGVSTKVPARFDGIDGQYCLGIGIDQESAIFVSRETNGQPKFPCSVTFFRLGDEVHARCTHQGHTFLTFSGTASGRREPDGDEVEDNEWWIKVSRAVGGAEKAYDLPPHVVRVRTAGVPTHVEVLDGERPGPPGHPSTELPLFWAPPPAELAPPRHTAREITLAGPLDPDAFWPHADTIGGSRWPGDRGAPRPAPGSRR